MMGIALWVVLAWFALSLLAAPLIGLLGRANDAPPSLRSLDPVLGED